MNWNRNSQDDITKNIIIIFFLIVVVDMIYISTFNSFFKKLFKKVQCGAPLTLKYWWVVVTYIFMSLVIYYFGYIKKCSVLDIFILGVSIYGVYELTNYTTLKDWDLRMVFLDTIWGGILFATTFYVSNAFHSKIVN